ncbi:MAG: hypothetical protein WD558_01705, partial [Pseudomonadales bacterium]
MAGKMSSGALRVQLLGLNASTDDPGLPNSRKQGSLSFLKPNRYDHRQYKIRQQGGYVSRTQS